MVGWLSLAYGVGLENRITRKGDGGSNPSPTANLILERWQIGKAAGHEVLG